MLFSKQIEKIYKSNLYKRNDNEEGIFYFSPTDFRGLCHLPFSFKSKKGARLQGYFYYFGKMSERQIVVFDHGYGNGHRAYMREIVMLALRGYTVFSYDHIGCMESGGESTLGFAQSLCDLDDCISALRRCPFLDNPSFRVVGHSWGGFSTMNISALHPDITHIVAISGFVSVYSMIMQNFRGILAPYRAGIMALERATNPEYVDFNAIDTLKGSKTKALLIHSSDDKLVRPDFHYYPMKRSLSECANVTLVLTENKGHNPNYTSQALFLKDTFFREFKKKRKQGKLKTPSEREEFMSGFDWFMITDQDNEVWEMIFNHLES